MEIRDNQLIVNDNGVERLFDIIFTYENEERGKKYVFFADPDTPSDVVVMSYTDEGDLFEIEDDEEYDEVEEVFNAYMEDPKIQEIKEEK